MPSFSRRSRQRLGECDPRLIRIFERVVLLCDCTVLVGRRGKRAQNEAYRSGHSKLRYPQSKHNREPSLAVDVAPYPIDWQDRERMTYFAGHAMAIAAEQGTTLRWGGDWNRNTQLADNTFDDLVHFEVME